MPETTRSLGDIRAEIDRIDETLHRLIVERTALAADVWKAKDRSVAGLAAIRPAREMQMLRAFAARHAGEMPIKVLWRIWREIIIANIRAQSPFEVHAPEEAGREAGIRDLARAHFGFETAYRTHDHAADVLTAAAKAGAVAILPTSTAAEWARPLANRSDMRIFAALPQIMERPGPPTAFLAGDVAIEPSGADTSVSLIDDQAATISGSAPSYTLPAGAAIVTGNPGDPSAASANDGRSLGAHADPLILPD